jgi:hypothetical protein
LTHSPEGKGNGCNSISDVSFVGIVVEAHEDKSIRVIE